MRRVSIATAACASVLLIACTRLASPGSPSQESETPSPAGSVGSSVLPSPSLAPTALPSQDAPSGALLEGFALNDILRVEVNGLAVRVKPYTDLPLATGWTLDGAVYTSIGNVRLNTGDFVSVDLGPLQIEDRTWYRVWPAEDGRLHYSTVQWSTKEHVPPIFGPGWVAAASGPDVYLTLQKADEPVPWLSGLPLLVSGTGDYVSGPLESTDLVALRWVYLIDDQSAPCDFTVALEPMSGGEALVAVDRSTIGAYEEGEAWLGTGDGVPVVGNAGEPFRLRVTSGCEWSLLLEPQAHD